MHFWAMGFVGYLVSLGRGTSTQETKRNGSQRANCKYCTYANHVCFHSWIYKQFHQFKMCTTTLYPQPNSFENLLHVERWKLIKIPHQILLIEVIDENRNNFHRPNLGNDWHIRSQESDPGILKKTLAFLHCPYLQMLGIVSDRCRLLVTEQYHKYTDGSRIWVFAWRKKCYISKMQLSPSSIFESAKRSICCPVFSVKDE
jgi:hypothetical protein